VTGLRYSEREMRARAERVITGEQSGTYKKIDLARDILTLLDRIERQRTAADDLRIVAEDLHTRLHTLARGMEIECATTRAPSRQAIREAVSRALKGLS
jgi:hypothetical protein